jgi:DNA-binding IclR family transcriptional regulator
MTAPAAPGPDYTNAAQQRILRLALLLAGHEITGLAPAQIAREQGCSASIVTRDLANLQVAGWAEKVPATGHWRLGPTPVQLAMRHMAGLDRAKRQMEEVANRYSRHE